MKKSFLLALVFIFGSGAAIGQERFTERLTPEQRKAAGLDLLTAEQLAALDALVKMDRESGERRVVEKAKQEARQELREEVKAAVKEELKAEVKAEVAAQVKEQARDEVKREEEQRRVAETRVLGKIKGKFSGWSGNTVFELENGQKWRQIGSEVYYVSPVDSPAVLIEKVFGGWRLYDQQGGWVKVVRIK
jgi:hypothetical protein